MFAESTRHVPFEIQRVFAIYHVAAGEHRGGHAHRQQHQFIIMLSGTCEMTVDDGTKRTIVPLTSIETGIHIPPLLWLDLDKFSSDAMCLVLASGRYDEADYIRNFDEFRNLTNWRSV